MWSSHPKKQSHVTSKGDDDLYRELWKAFAGQSMDVPRVGELVYYFPGLHVKQLEQSSNQELNQGTPISDPYLKILCHVVHVRFLVGNISEEVYAEINLLPKHDQTEPVNPDFYHSKIPRPQIHSFCKVLTASDTKSNWGLSIPQKDAVKCFPLLDMSRDKPIQELVVKDLFGKEWRFKHVFGGHPRRHLLTNGWSAFVNSKKLVSGDLVVFLREKNGDAHVGFRHQLCHKSSVEVPIASSLDIKGVLAVASDALASQRPFSVYCKPETSQFIISLNKYLEAINRGLGVSLTFKMPYDVANSHGSFTCMANEKDQMQINHYSQNANVFLNEDEEHMEDAEAIVYSPPQHSTTPSELGEKRHSDHTIYISSVEGNVESTYEDGTRKHNEVSNPVEIESIQGTEERKAITSSSWDFNTIQEQDVEDAEIIKDIILPIVSQNLPLDYTVSSKADNDHFLRIMQDSEGWQNFQGTDYPLHVQSPSGNHNMQTFWINDQRNSSMHPTSISSQIPYDGPGHGDEKVHWEGYHVARRYIPILNRIISQYPSTLSSFKATSPIFQSMCLEILAELVYLLGQFTMASMDINNLSEAKRYLRDLKLSGIEIGWLEKRLVKVEDIFTMKRISIRRQELVLGIEDTTATLRLMNEELGSFEKELQKLSSNINLKTPAEDRPILEGLL